MFEEEKEAIDIVTKAKFVNGDLIMCDTVDYAWAVGKLIQGVNKRDKIIELMADEYINIARKLAFEVTHYEIPCCDRKDCTEDCKKCFKEYVIKKVEEEDAKNKR